VFNHTTHVREFSPIAEDAWLRANDPVHFHSQPDGPGFWAITRYDDVRIVCRQPRRSVPTSPASCSLTPRIEELAEEIVDDVIERGECNLVRDIAGRLQSGLIAELMGIPRSDGERLYELTEIMHTNHDSPDFAMKQMMAIGEMLGYAQSVAQDKRKDPSDNIATTFVRAEIDGDRLTDDDFAWFGCWPTSTDSPPRRSRRCSASRARSPTSSAPSCTTSSSAANNRPPVTE